MVETIQEEGERLRRSVMTHEEQFNEKMSDKRFSRFEPHPSY